MEKDAEIIANYSNPTWVLGGWTPAMAPRVLIDPVAVTAAAGQTVTVNATVAAVPPATFQWFRNGVALRGATTSTLTLNQVKAGDAGSYTVTATNGSGSDTSRAAALKVK
jgi:hypothetical protein